MGNLPDRLKRFWFSLEDRFFAWRYSLDLSGVIPNGDLVSNWDELARHATAYQAVWCRNLRKLLAEVDLLGVPFERFIDIGSGKGKACFYADTKRSFKSIIGVEFSAPLLDIALGNKKRLRSDSIEFVCADAAQFHLPDGNTIVFMFNPFDDVILTKFIELNIEHFKKYQTVIAYSNDLQRSTLTKLGFETVFRDQTRKISLHAYRK